MEKLLLLLNYKFKSQFQCLPQALFVRRYSPVLLIQSSPVKFLSVQKYNMFKSVCERTQVIHESLQFLLHQRSVHFLCDTHRVTDIVKSCKVLVGDNMCRNITCLNPCVNEPKVIHKCFQFLPHQRTVHSYHVTCTDIHTRYLLHLLYVIVWQLYL